MLNESCRRFRADFAAERAAATASHRHGCAACAAWAAEVEAAADWTRTAAVAAQPLPASLRSRLRSIPQQVATCRDVDRLYAAARRRAAGRPPEPATAAHLAACDRCRTLYGTLESAFSERLPPPPPGLVAALKEIVRRPERLLPQWIAEPRLATAACILMTVLLSSMAADAAALFRDAGDAVSAQAAEWAEEGQSRSHRMWQSTVTAITTSHATSRERLAGFAESCQTFFDETVRIFGSITQLQIKKTDGGPSHGEPDSPTE
jgi:hypothetical protein